MLDERTAWAVFGGCAFILMGAGLFSDAGANAQAMRDWQDRLQLDAPSRGGEPPGTLVWLYRAGGLLFVAAGACLLAALALMPGLLPANARHGGAAGRLLGGMLFTVCGGLLASSRAAQWTRERRAGISFLSGALLAALFIIFGAFLFSRLIQGDAP